MKRKGRSLAPGRVLWGPYSAMLRAVDCQVSRSGLFRIVLTPDYDGDHYNHFHLEALPWRERSDRDPSARLDAAWSAVDRRPLAGGR